ncbi:Glucokinase [hydrothermal vent metagenome]|uniref:Glucokinase n=1 Tax=hydrothermal vent metagenome TaxID=652676 RepID=A0A3B0TM99_9ZZZZ
MSAPNVIVADIGGTHIRLAIASGGAVAPATAKRYAAGDFAGPAEAVRHYLEETGQGRPDAACLALAGPVLGRRVSMVNNRWVVDADAFETRTGIADCRLINDFEALALALPSLVPADLIAVGGGVAVPGCRAVLGPGTGLGVAVLAQRDGVAVAVPSEGGHSGFAPVDAVEIEILRHMTRTHGRVSNERLISGPGLEALHITLADIDGRPRTALTALQIIDKGLEDRNSEAWRTICAFSAIFGTLAGDIALLVGAVGGIYLAGGIAQRLATVFEDTDFRARFEAKGRLSYFTETIPVHVITGAYAALDGAAAAYANLGAPHGGRRPPK